MEICNQPGESLRAAREAAGWSIADVVHRMKFPRTIVEALERDDYTVFPSPTYARSYLSQYAEFLNIDPSKWLDFFEPADFAGPQDVMSMIESPAEPESHHSHSSARSGGSGSMLPTVLLLLLTGGLIYGAVSGYAYLEKRLGESISTKQPAASSVEQVSSNSPSIPPAQASPQNPAQAQTNLTSTVPNKPAAANPPDEPVKAPRATIVVEE